jgi:predicted transcriptional regulator
MKKLKYLNHYPTSVQKQVQTLVDANKLGKYLLDKYPTPHIYKNDKALFSYVQTIKNDHMKKTSPWSGNLISYKEFKQF